MFSGSAVDILIVRRNITPNKVQVIQTFSLIYQKVLMYPLYILKVMYITQKSLNFPEFAFPRNSHQEHSVSDKSIENFF